MNDATAKLGELALALGRETSPHSAMRVGLHLISRWNERFEFRCYARTANGAGLRRVHHFELLIPDIQTLSTSCASNRAFIDGDELSLFNPPLDVLTRNSCIVSHDGSESCPWRWLGFNHMGVVPMQHASRLAGALALVGAEPELRSQLEILTIAAGLMAPHFFSIVFPKQLLEPRDD